MTIDGGYLLGIDLGSGASMSAAAAYDPGSGALDYVAALPKARHWPVAGSLTGLEPCTWKCWRPAI